ncbi:hypothetical protein COT47_02005, partial [Candidatus Woesearchaeota archaeon CG08_land_8_20_14_0_20_43_7]
MKDIQKWAITNLMLLFIILLPVHTAWAVSITGVSVTKGSDSANIAFTTDKPSSIYLRYGPTQKYGKSLTDSALTTNHLLKIAGLTADTLYFYEINATDGNNTTMAVNGSFSTINVSVNSTSTTATKSTSSPSSGTLDFTIPAITNLNSLDIIGKAASDSTIQIFVNGQLKGTTTVKSTGEFTLDNVALDTNKQNNTIKVISKEKSGTVTTEEKSILIDTKPPILTIQKFDSKTKQSTFYINGTVNEAVTIYFQIIIADTSYADTPPKITGFNATGGDGTVKLDWNRPNMKNINRYLIYRSDIGLIDQTSDEYYTDKSVNDKTKYTYQVSVEDNLCSEGYRSDAVSATTLGTNITRKTPVLQNSSCQVMGTKSMTANGAFTYRLSLKTGNNTIKITAVDAAGNKATETYMLLSDNDAPTFKNTNLDAITPSYLCQETVRGQLDELSTVYIYLNDATIPSYQTKTDAENKFAINAKFSKSLDLKITTSDFNTTNQPNTQSKLQYGEEKWQNKVKIVAIDEAGNNESETATVVCANCGQGSDWQINIGEITPNEITPRFILDGIGQIGFTYNLTWRGIGDAPTIKDITMGFYPLSDHDTDKYDSDWVRKPINLIKGNNPVIGYVEVPFRRMDPRTGAQNDSMTTYQLENNISMNHYEECLMPGAGCIRLPLMMTIEYGDTGLQKQCWNTEVFIQPPFLNPDSAYIKPFLNASVMAIDAAMQVINKTLTIIRPVTKYTLIACLSLFVVSWLQYISEYMSCAGTGDGSKCECDESGCTTEACTACYQAKKTSMSVAKLQHYVCDRIFCPAAPTFDSFVEDIQKQGKSSKIKTSNCIDYTIDYEKASTKDNCDGSMVPPITKPNPECCEEEYMERWDSSILLMDEFEKSKCLKNPNAEGCSSLGQIFDWAADFSFCGNGEGSGVQFVTGSVCLDDTCKKTVSKSFVVDLDKKKVWLGDKSEVGKVDPATKELVTVKNYVDNLGAQVFDSSDCTKDKKAKNMLVPQTIQGMICPQDSIKKYVADPTSGILRSIQAVCLSAISNYLSKYQAILGLIRACFNTILVTGDGSAGVCKAVLSTYICDFIYYLIKCVQEPTDEGYGVKYDGIKGVFTAMSSATAKIKQGVTDRYGSSNLYQVMFVQKKLIHSLCTAAFTGDWDINWDSLVEEATKIPIDSTVVIAPANRRFMAFNPINGYTTHIYNIGMVVIAGADLTYDVDLVCSNSGNCKDFVGGRCDCMGTSEKVLRVTGQFGNGQLNQGEVIDNAPYVQVKADNTQYANVRYDKVRITYKYKSNSGVETTKTVEESISQVGGSPPNQCKFYFPSGFLCTFLTDADGIAYYTKWPEVVYDNTYTAEGGYYKIGDRIVLKSTVQTLPPSDPSKQNSIKKFAKVTVKNQHNSIVYGPAYFPVSDMTSDNTRLIPEASFKIMTSHFGQYTSSKASCTVNQVSGATSLGLSTVYSTSSAPQMVIIKYEGGKYKACAAEKKVSTAGATLGYQCSGGKEIYTDLVKQSSSQEYQYSNVFFSENKNEVPKTGAATALDCAAVQQQNVDVCPTTPVTWTVQVTLHSGTDNGSISQTPEYYQGKSQDSGELSVKVKCYQDNTTLKCGIGSVLQQQCLCTKGLVMESCNAGSICCATGCRSDGKDCNGNSISGATTTTGCSPITILSSISAAQMKTWYGDPMNMPSANLGTTTFRGKTITMNKKVLPLFDCISKEIDNTCSAADKNYQLTSVSDTRETNTYSGGGISKHLYGIAIDLNPATNPFCYSTPTNQGASGSSKCPTSPSKPEDNIIKDLPQCWIDAMQKYGFLWGGTKQWSMLEAAAKDWGRDSMHFNFYGDPSTIGAVTTTTTPTASTSSLKFDGTYAGYSGYKTSNTPSCNSGQDCMIDFSYNDNLLLSSGSKSSRIWVPSEARTSGGSYPLVVMLHGANTAGVKNLMISSVHDVPSVAKGLIVTNQIKPVIIAAPSQTKDAGASLLWPSSDFDLVTFVNEVEKTLAANNAGVTIDKTSVSVFGHSSAGQQIGYGLFKIAKDSQDGNINSKGVYLKVVGMIDTSSSSVMGSTMKSGFENRKNTDVFGVWQGKSVDSLANAMGVTSTDSSCDSTLYSRCKMNGDGWRVYEAQTSTLSSMFPSGIDNHNALVL